MKKSKFIGLGITALALGVVAGAIGAQKATEVKAATLTDVYLAIDASTVGSYTVKLNINRKGDGDDWANYIMTATGETYESKPVYTCRFTDLYNGVGKMQFQLYDGETWKAEDTAISSWTGADTYNGKLHVYNESGWVDYGEVPSQDESAHVFKLVGTGSAALGNWNTTNSTLTMTAAGVSGYLKKIESVSLAANDKFKVVDVDADGWYAGSFLATDDTREKIDFDGDGNFLVGTAGTYDIYIKDSENSHKVAILTHGEDLANVKEETPIANGYYILGLGGDWAPRHGVLDDKEGGSTNLAEFHNVTLTAGDKFKIARVEDGAAVSAEYYGWSSFVNMANGGYVSDMTGKLKEAASDGNFEVVTTDTYNLYFYEVESVKKISIVDATFTDQDAVDMFVAQNITPYIDEAWKTQTAEQRVESCTEKYNRAKTAHDAHLSAEQKTLFATNARYTEAYAAYSKWASVVGGGAVISVNGLTETSKTAIIIATVSLGAIAAAAGFVFLRKKRNNA